jgi:hypothetical protein
MVFVRVANKGVRVMWRVRVANTRLKVAVFSTVCGGLVRVARKAVREGRPTGDSSKPTAGRKGKANAEALSAQKWC